MKTCFSLLAAAFLPFLLTAQTANVHQQAVPVKTQNRALLRQSASGANTVNSISFTETVIGNTLYDLQSNEGVGRRIVNNSNGSISAAWTFSSDPDQLTYPDRGTAYNFFNGISWGPAPTARIENTRTGFTNISVAGGKEYVMTHSSAGGVLTSRTQGLGGWTNSSPVGGTSPGQDSWFRMAVGGSNNMTIHAIVNSQGTLTTPVLGQRGPITYSRSTNGGTTWDIQHVVLPGSNSTFYSGFAAENYSIDCSGDTVVVVAGVPLKDVVLWKSIDNGANWTKTIIRAAPVAAYNTSNNYTALRTDINGDGIGDTVVTCSGDVNVTLDMNGVAHVTWSNIRAWDNDVVTSSYGFDQASYGISFWKEGMVTPNIIDGIVDENGDGRFTVITSPAYDPYSLVYKQKGLICSPQLGFDSLNNVFLVYSAVSETSDTLSYQAQYRHVYFTYSVDGGNSWTLPEDLMSSNSQEGLWPSISKRNGNFISVLYQRDDIPDVYLGDGAGGSFLCTQNQGELNQMIYVRITNPATASSVSMSGASSVCPNSSSTYTLNNVSGASSINWTVPSGAAILSGQNTTSINVQFGTTSGNVQATVTYPGGGTVIKLIQVTVENVIVNATASTNNFCSGGSAILTATGAATYAWSPSTGLSSSTGSPVTATPLTTTTYTVTGTSAAGCTGTRTITVTVLTRPTVSASAATPTICSGLSTTLTATGASTYVWSPGATLSGTTGSSVTATPTNTITYNVTGTAANGCTASSSVTVTVNVRPTVSAIATDSSICAGTSTTLTANGANTYAWSPTTGLSASTGSSVTATPASTTTYTVTGTAANGCTSTSTVQLTILSLPSTNVSAVTNNICIGDSVQITASGANTYSWSPSAGLSSSNSAVVKASPTATTTYTVTGTALNGCTSTATTTINVFNIPNVSASANDAIICNGQTATLTATGATSYAWTPSTGLSATTGATVSATPASTTTYSVTGTSNGCSATATVSVTISQVNLVTAATLGTICTGDSTEISVTGADSYLWTPFSEINTDTGNVIMASPVSTTTYTVTGTNSEGCTASQSITITVSTSLSINIAASSNNVCLGSSVQLTASGANSFVWSPSTSLSGTSGNIVTADPTTAITYTVTGTSTNGCTGSNTISLTVSTPPVVDATAASYSICQGQSTNLSASGAVNYAWSPSNGITNVTGATTSATPSSTTIYTVTGTDALGCTSSDTVEVDVRSLPNVSATSPGQIICLGGSSTLNASGASTYVWTPTTGLNGTTGNSVVASPGSSTTYTVTGTGANGCSSSASITVTVNALPVMSINSSNPSFCSGGNTTLTAIGANTFQWNPSTGLNNTSGISVTASPTSTTVYTVTGTDANGCTATATNTVNVFPIPNLTVTTNPNLCIGNTTTLTASGANTYNWSPSTGLNATTGSSVQASPVTTTTYTVTGTSVSGCSTSVTTTVNVSTPFVAVSQNRFCISSGDIASLSASGATTYSWSPSSGLNSTNGANVQASPTTTTVYTVTGTNSVGCTTTATVTVNVDNFPVAVISNSSPVQLCPGAGVFLSLDSTNNGWTYQWLESGNAIFGETSNQYFTNQAGNYSVVITNAASCSTTSNAVTVNQLNAPAVSFSVSPASSICIGDAITLSGTGANTYSWSGGITNGISFVPSASGSYTIVGTDLNGCTASATAAITVNNYPLAQQIIGDTSVVPGVSYAYSVPSEAGVTYQWSVSGGALLNGQSTNSVDIEWTSGQTHVLQLILSTSAGCTDTLVLNAVDNNCILTFTLAQSGSSTPCAGEAVILSIQASSSASLQWYQDGNVMPGETNDTLTVTSSGNYSIGIVIGPCDTISDATTINYHPAVIVPVINAASLSGTCTVQQDTLFVTTSYSGYSWSSGESNSTLVIDSPGTYTVTVTDQNGCTATSAPFVYTNQFVSAPEICALTVDTITNETVIIWNAIPSYGADSVIVYQQAPGSGLYVPVNRTDASLTSYVNLLSSPEVMAERYAISILDTCGNETLQSMAHQTIHLQGLVNPGDVTLLWNQYEGFGYPTHYIYRGTSPSSLQLIDSVLFSQTVYTDLNPPVGTLYYRIGAMNPNTCASSAAYTYSNTIDVLFTGVESLAERITDVSVFPNPVAETATIRFRLVGAERTVVSISDISGRVVAVLGDAVLSPGIHQLNWNVKEVQSSGVYFVQIRSKDFNVTRRIAVMR